MDTIKEAYVSLKVARLMKEKGFAEPCGRYYNSRFNEFSTVGSICMMNWNLSDEYLSIPTQQMAVAWLREVHKLHICIEYDHPKFVSDIFRMDVIDEHGCAEHVSPTFANCRTYEGAVEAALEYALENLI